MNLINKEKFYEMIGSSIVNKRKELGLTQVELANKVGMSRTSIVNIENANQFPPLHILWEISFALETSIVDMLPNNAHDSFVIEPPKPLKDAILKTAKKEDLSFESISKINSFVLGL